MGACSSLLDKDDASACDKESLAISDQIDRDIVEEKKRNESVMKLLLLGPGESGKSTLIKQLRIIHLNGFSDLEMLSRRGVIFSNLVQSMYMLVYGVQQVGLHYSPERQNDADLINDIVARREDGEPPSEDVANALRRLTQDPVSIDAMGRRSEFQINDSAPYFFEAIDRICAPAFVPTVLDILMSRVPTSGVHEIKFTYRKVEFRIFDVGGQKSERRKWIHCFDDVNAIIFVAAISEYDQALREDGKTNRMIDALALFSKIVNHSYFKKSQVILFMNKKDLFAEKIKEKPLTVLFKRYKGTQDYDSCTAYLQRCFEKLKKDDEKMLYAHFTCATDTNQVQLVLNSTTDMIIAENFKQTGIM